MTTEKRPIIPEEDDAKFTTNAEEFLEEIKTSRPELKVEDEAKESNSEAEFLTDSN